MDSVRQLIEQGDLRAAAKMLVEVFDKADNGREYANEARVLESRISTLTRNLRRGQISQDQASVKQNQIGFALLELLDEAATTNPTSKAMKVFISYRRDQGAAYARAVRLALEERGISVFLDVEDLGSGAFGPALLAQIDDADAVVAILSQGALDRCQDTEDWVRIEIVHALKTNKKFITLLMSDFRMPDDLPQELTVLPQQNGVNYSHEYFDATIGRLCELMR